MIEEPDTGEYTQAAHPEDRSFRPGKYVPGSWPTVVRRLIAHDQPEKLIETMRDWLTRAYHLGDADGWDSAHDRCLVEGAVVGEAEVRRELGDEVFDAHVLEINDEQRQEAEEKQREEGQR